MDGVLEDGGGVKGGEEAVCAGVREVLDLQAEARGGVVGGWWWDRRGG